jgi:uncharacterized protein (TIGR03437 family)
VLGAIMSKSLAIFALLAFWAFAIPADGQSLSFLPRYIPIGDDCCSVLTGDFNRDGRMDIVVAHAVSGVTVLLGNGDGSFTRIETALAPGSVIDYLYAVADFNSDGILDLLVVVRGRTGVMFGNGNGTFRSPAVFDVGSQYGVAAVGDFNGDGKPDLLVNLGNGFAVRLGNGDGTFQPTGPITPFPEGDFYPAMVGDFNNDGKADVAWTTARCCSGARIWLGDGRGGFQNNIDYAGGGGSSSFKELAVGDLNRDGNLDLVVGTPLGVSVSLGKGDGAFRVLPYYYYPWFSRTNTGESVTVADLNGDGIADVIYGSTVLLGNGDGSLLAPLPAPIILGQWGILAAADFNGDGKPDLVAGGNGTGLSVLINNTPGTDSSAAAVSAASHAGPVAPGSIASVFGKGLATTTASALGLPWPTDLDNVRVLVLDQNGVERLAGIIYVSPSQINFQVPLDTAEGYAIVNVDNGKTPFIKGARATAVQSVAPGFFTADGTGTGVAAATAVHVQGDTRTSVPVFQCSSPGSCTPVPIDLSLDGTVYLSVYGTGFANAYFAEHCYPLPRGSSADLPITYSGLQREFPGLDQLNFLLPKTLSHGRVDVACEFYGGNSAVFTVYTK